MAVGSAAFKAKLARVPEAIRDAVNEANRVNVEEWAQWARAAAPVGKDGTPDLRESIRTYKSETGGWVIRAGGETTTVLVQQGQSGSYDYARAQEFGTQDMPANPYFWTSYRLLKKRLNSRRRRALNKAIKAFNGS